MITDKAPAAGSSLWLASRGTRHAFPVGIALIFAIPMLLVAFILREQFGLQFDLPPQVEMGIIIAIPCFAGMGYNLLQRYPANILRLRRHLQEVVKQEVPEAESLIAHEDDMRAIEGSLNLLLRSLREKLVVAQCEHDALHHNIEAEKTLVNRMNEAGKTKDQFIESVARELRTPMAPLDSAIQLFLSGSLGTITSEQREILALMHQNIGKISAIADDILALSQGKGATSLSIAQSARNDRAS